MKAKTLLFSVVGTVLGSVLLLTACSSDAPKQVGNNMASLKLKGDSTIYGLACEGCTDSVVVMLPSDDSDPVTYNIIEAKRNGHVLGKLQIGDRIGILRNKTNKHVADYVIDIDRLRGIWCYIVMPKMRYFEHMSKQLQAKLMNNMSDSLKETFLIPREYGFYLKPEWEAQSVGYVSEANALADESPVVYPPLSYFTSWQIWNGKLVMVSGTPHFSNNGPMKVTDVVYDTCKIDYLGEDSLVLSSDGESRSYYRKANLNDINARARAIEAMRSKKALEETKEQN